MTIGSRARPAVDKQQQGKPIGRPPHAPSPPFVASLSNVEDTLLRWSRTPPPLSDDVRAWMIRTLAAWKWLSDDHRERLERAAARLLARIDVEAARGFEVTDEMIGTTIGHAALLAIGRHDRTFHDVRAVVIHPRTITLDGERAGPIPETVVAGPEPVAGHTSEHGPVFIDWRSLRHEAQHPEGGRNVAFHEFAHKLDAENGPIDGNPTLGRDLAKRWVEVTTAEYRDLRRGRGTRLLNAYAASAPGEFFAVTTELFFTRPVALALDRPQLYEVFRDYYGQDPAREWTTDG